MLDRDTKITLELEIITYSEITEITLELEIITY